MREAKPYRISKWEVWEAYKRVKANQGAAGVDEQSIRELERNLKGNLSWLLGDCSCPLLHHRWQASPLRGRLAGNVLLTRPLLYEFAFLRLTHLLPEASAHGLSPCPAQVATCSNEQFTWWAPYIPQDQARLILAHRASASDLARCRRTSETKY